MHDLPRAALLLLCLGAVAAQDAAAEDGAALHEAHCTRCHDAAIYGRSDRKVRDWPGLVKQVRLCEQQVELGWFDEEVEAVADHLDRLHYHFRP